MSFSIIGLDDDEVLRLGVGVSVNVGDWWMHVNSIAKMNLLKESLLVQMINSL